MSHTNSKPTLRAARAFLGLTLLLAFAASARAQTTPSVGVGTTAPRHKLEVNNGSALVTNGEVIVGSPGEGVILTSPSGNCFRLTVSDAGRAR